MTEIQPSQTFNERMKERVREGIGELLTDEEVEQIVQRAMHEVFFQPRVVNKDPGSFHQRKEELPPLAHEIVREELEPLMRQEITRWLGNNKDEVHRIIKETLERDAGEALMRGITDFFRSEMSNFQMNVENRLNSL